MSKMSDHTVLIAYLETIVWATIPTPEMSSDEGVVILLAFQKRHSDLLIQFRKDIDEWAENEN